MGTSNHLTRSSASWWSRQHLVELLVVFLIGAAVMRFFFSGTGWGTDLRPNLAGNDCFYHTKMAALLPEIGLPDTFPWLSQTIFNERFVNHHWGFHLYLMPFVRLSHRLTGDYIPGARWAMCVSFGLTLVTAMLILMSERIRWRWLWLVLFLTLPAEFYIRHAYTRAIDLSLFCLLLGCLFMLRRRHLALALTMVLYTHIYLGSFFMLILAGIHLVSGLFERPRPRFDLPLLLWVVVGAGVGIVTHPYFPENLGFLQTQIFGSGLTPEISVGREWDPYGNVWSFANLIGIPLWTLAFALALRLSLGRRMTRNQWTMLLACFFFFVLILKARRFVEYWPAFAILAAALLAGPLFGREPLPGEARRTRHSPTWLTGVMSVVAALCITAAAFAVWYFDKHYVDMLSWWPLWTLLGIAYVGVALWRARRSAARAHPGPGVVIVCATAVAVVSLWFLAAAPLYQAVRHWAKGQFNLDEVEAAMTALQAHSEPGDVVFTDDWDIFTVYFHFNHHNRYIVGLDPVFTYRRDPELWERYVKITQGKVPCVTTAKVVEAGELVERRIHVSLEDIRDRFGAGFVIVDRDHQVLARLLEKAPKLAQKIYPSSDDRQPGVPAFTVYEILDSSSPQASRSCRSRPKLVK